MLLIRAQSVKAYKSTCVLNATSIQFTKISEILSSPIQYEMYLVICLYAMISRLHRTDIWKQAFRICTWVVISDKPSYPHLVCLSHQPPIPSFISSGPFPESTFSRNKVPSPNRSLVSIPRTAISQNIDALPPPSRPFFASNFSSNQIPLEYMPKQ